MQPSPGDLGVVLAKTYNTTGGTSAGATQHSGGFGVQVTKGSEQLDAQPYGVLTNSTPFGLGLLLADLFASRLTKQTLQYYTWRPDPEATAIYDAFTQEFSLGKGFINPMFYTTMPDPNKTRTSQVVLITSLAISTLVSGSTGDVGRLLLPWIKI